MKLIVFIVIISILLFISSMLVVRFIQTRKMKKSACMKCKSNPNILDTLSEESGYPITTPTQHLNLYSFPDVPLKYSSVEEESAKFEALQESIDTYVKEKKPIKIFDPSHIAFQAEYPKDVMTPDIKRHMTWLVRNCLTVINMKLKSCFGNIEYNKVTIEKDMNNHFRTIHDIFIYEKSKHYRVHLILTVIVHNMDIWLQHVQFIHQSGKVDNGLVQSPSAASVPNTKCHAEKTNDNYNRWIDPNIPDTTIHKSRTCRKHSTWNRLGVF